MHRYVIERDVRGIDQNDAAGYCGVARTSNAALRKLAARIQWNHSYVVADKLFCIYMAEDEDAIREHARISGFPANKISLVVEMIDPTTAI
jgi:Protein of unknown function (DUF4242)